MSSPERKSLVASSRGEGVGEDTEKRLTARRSNSLGSLSEPDCYMNALWPRLSAPASQVAQCDSEEPLSSSDDAEFSFFTHKRSNSCSSDDRLKVSKPVAQSALVAPAAHTRKSVEGLNQEVSSALAGNPILLVESVHPDGHVAPVQDLLGSASVGTQTPPSLGSGCGLAQTPSQSPSPFPPPPPPLPSSPSTLTSSHVNTTSDSTHSSIHGTSNRESPGLFQHPYSPKPSFAREPPDGAERCTIKVETSLHMEGYVPMGPDKSKGTIVFKGTAFAPPLITAAQNLQLVP